MYKTHIKQWGLDKKNKEQEMRAIVRKTNNLKDQGQTATFRVRGRLVDHKDVIRYWERKGISITDVVAQRSNSKTPEAVRCFASSSCSSPSSPLMTPESIAVPERILVSIRDYFTGSFENGTWFTTDPRLPCESTKAQENSFHALTSFYESSRTACGLFNMNCTQEAGQMLISATSKIKDILLAEHPQTLADFFDLVIGIFQQRRNEVALAILRQVSALARIVLGGRHPLYVICGSLASLHASDLQKVIVKCCASMSDHFERLVGPMHRSTLVSRGSFLNAIAFEKDDSHEILLLRELLGKCEATLGYLDVRTLRIYSDLAYLYFCKFDYVEALKVSRDIVARSQLRAEAQNPQQSFWQAHFHAEGLYIAAMSLRGLGEMDSAEQHLREAIDARISVYGPRDIRVGEWLLRLGDLLTEKGELESAAEIEQRWKQTIPETSD